MKNFNEVSKIFSRATKELETWDVYDQLTYLTKLTELADMVDGIMAKYDGRRDRVKQFLDSLKGEKDEKTS